MISRESLDKIVRKSKNLLWESSRAYNSQGRSCVPYEELIVSSPRYPEQYFLVHKNMIFEKGTICDSSFSVFSFDKDGNLLDKEDITDTEFFRTMQVLKKI